MNEKQLIGVLDGQQRLTALNIGLRGSMAWKRRRMWWNNPAAFPKRRLHLDLLWQPDEDNEDGLKYRFEFLTEERFNSAAEDECWFPVADIMTMGEGGLLILEWLNSRLPQEQLTQAFAPLETLRQVVHDKHLVAYYQENDQDLDKVLQIFIRTNNGGTELSYSDLLLSVAVAQWADHDAREEIHDLVDTLNRIGGGFSFSKDLVLKAGLMLSDIGSVGFKVENFNRANMSIFEGKWEAIARALTLTVQLVANFGFSRQSLSSANSILPIAYYLFLKDPGDSYLTHSDYEEDRQRIRKWLTQSLLKRGIWGSGLDTLLTAVRQIVRDNDSDAFPVGRIRAEMARRGKSLVFEEEEIEDLLDMRYSDYLTFALLSMLFPFIDLRNMFHVDHIFPRARFTSRRLGDAGVPDDKIDLFRNSVDELANLQLLQGAENIEKRDRMPDEWLSQTYPGADSRRAYEDRHLLGDVPESLTEFDVFYNARRERLKERVRQLLGR